jgi:hypothetical protein
MPGISNAGERPGKWVRVGRASNQQRANNNTATLLTGICLHLRAQRYFLICHPGDRIAP